MNIESASFAATNTKHKRSGTCFSIQTDELASAVLKCDCGGAASLATRFHGTYNFDAFNQKHDILLITSQYLTEVIKH